MPVIVFRPRERASARVAGREVAVAARVTLPTGPTGFPPPPSPPVPPDLVISSIVVEDLGGGDFTWTATFTEKVAGFRPTLQAPLWTFADANGPIPGLVMNNPAGNFTVSGSWNGAYLAPFSITVPEGGTQLRSMAGGVLPPGIYTS